ncbi:MAG: hypothetical protein WH035_06180, partial [Spirochaetota bacterium]
SFSFFFLLILLTFILLIFIFSENLIAQEYNFNISIFSMYRTCEMIEITGNEDQFDIILNINLEYLYSVFSNWTLFLFANLDFRLPYSTKARFYEYFAPDLIENRKTGFLFSNNKVSFVFLWGQNLSLGYHFENYYPSVIQKLPSYPLSSSYYGDINQSYDYTLYLPYPAFMLGPRQLPIYYVNAIYLMDCIFYFKWNIQNFYLIIGTSTGELGLDSNSSKAFIVKTGFDSKNLIFYLSMNLTERGSVPIKIHSQFFSIYFEYNNNNLTFAIEGIFNLHGIRDPRLNPYDQNNNIDIEIYNYGPGLFIPDDLPNLIDEVQENGRMPPLLGAGGFIYFSYIFYLKNNSSLKFFFHYSIYDPNLKNETYLIYQIKHRIVFGFNFTQKVYSIILGATFTYDSVFLNIPQFYEAENRFFHKIANYDLILCVSVYI